MALTPIDETHALQIQAGTLGRRAGHAFEATISSQINSFAYPLEIQDIDKSHIFTGNPAIILIHYICKKYSIKKLTSATSISTGSLATSEEGKKWLSVNGVPISRCKSDLLITLSSGCGKKFTIGVSTKQCNHKNPTNAQLFFTTAQGFSNLLHANGISISESAVTALKQFCGNEGFRPGDMPPIEPTGSEVPVSACKQSCDVETRRIDPRRFFWEEIDPTGRKEWEDIFARHQSKISQLLFKKAYLDDPFEPEFLLHKIKSASDWDTTDLAIYTIDELVALSCQHGGFNKKEYSVNKGRYKDPPSVAKHEAPRFGIIQMQRAGQKQHPEQLQFNLEAGYFYKLEQLLRCSASV